MPTLTECVVALEESLTAADVPHAFGGALALAFHVEEPRGTRDIDVNVFVAPDQVAGVFAALPDGVASGPDDLRRVALDGQVRLFWDETPIDVFFATHDFHHTAALHAERVPFAGMRIPILAATELVVFKAFFDRTKDWADIEAIVDADAADLHEAIGWLVDLLGVDDPRVARLREQLHRTVPAVEPRFAPPT